MDRLGGSFGSQDDGLEPEFAHDSTSDAFRDPLAVCFDTDSLADQDFDGEDEAYDYDLSPPSPVGQDERRMQVRAYNLWAAQLGDRNLPPIGSLDPAGLEDFGPYSVLLDFSSGVDDPVLRHIGTALAAECSADGTIQRLSDVPSRSLLSRITDHYMQILANQAPIGFEAEFLNERGNTALYRGILLPYSRDPEAPDATIDFIYGVINWKELADPALADELLLEIGQALEMGAARGVDARSKDIAAVLDLDASMTFDDAQGDDGSSDRLPTPSFGRVEGVEGVEGTRPARTKRPALPTPDYAAEEDYAETIEERDDEQTTQAWSIGETAGDYGLADDWDEPDEEDVDGVVDPLADDSVGPGLAALVTRGQHRASEVIMPGCEAERGEPATTEYPIPRAYEPPAEPFTAGPVREETGSKAETATETESDGLYDCLAEARELALAARSSEDRSRGALYDAVGRAYDFSLEAQADPDGFAEIVADAGLTVQDRAPMTPVVKLVFGVDYDKTRLTEYAAVLTHAHRSGLGRGTLPEFLAKAEGGLKGVVREERRLRREEAGKPIPGEPKLRAELAELLRQMDPVAFADLAVDGPEFALVMIRRDEAGTIATLGEIPQDIALIERAARVLAA